ncbi:PKS/NRPS-like protein [Pseudogymnoascus sp. 23342-1-I1]|nr:PKS/NRPS-like protein [Pseudogymnoascus sp. 23342-1-I1]
MAVLKTQNTSPSARLEENVLPPQDIVTPQIGFLFTGQGSQWFNMGRELIGTTTAFGVSMRKSDEFLSISQSSWNLLDELHRSNHSSQVDKGHIAIPATTAIQIALVDLLESLDILPHVVLGHSTGEIAAAYASKILTHQDAIMVAFQLGQVLHRRGLFDGCGKMLAVGLGESEIQPYLDLLDCRDVYIACENSPLSTTVSGSSATVDQLQKNLQSLGIFNKGLIVPAAYHSPQMECIESEYMASIHTIEPSSPESVNFYSSTTGRRKLEDFGPSYWINNVVSKVLYRSALQKIIASTPSSSQLLLIEIGPQPHLRRPTEECICECNTNTTQLAYFSSLLRGKDACRAAYELSHGISLRGYPVHSGNLAKLGETYEAINAEKEISQGHKCFPINSNNNQALKTIYQDLSDEILKLTGNSRSECQAELPISDYGLDSLLAVEFADWINQKYALHFSVGEIFDASSLLALVQSIGMLTQDYASNIDEPPPPKKVVASQGLNGLPRLPLPNLRSTLENYYSSVECFGTDSELLTTQQTIGNFINSEEGCKLQDRLLARVHDPILDCWLADLYNGSNFLDRNVPLVPFGSFFYTHKLSKFQHTQAERAAVVTKAALQYKEDLESGIISPDILQGQPSCTYLFKYLFNTSRKPCIGSDIIGRFLGNNYIVVLWRGRAFKVPLYDNGSQLSFVQLKGIFERIMQKADGDSLQVGILTSDERTSWAKIRKSLQVLHPQNLQYLHAIEAAAFLVCLDEASPETASERAHHFHFGTGGNRWNDKSVQFVVCTNGVSGFVGDHSMLDAGTVLGLNRFVTRAILQHRHEPDISPSVVVDISAYLDEKKLVISPYIDLEISRVIQDFNENIKDANHVFFTLSNFGGSICRLNNYPPKSLFQLIVALASKLYFGAIVPLWETVSLGNFHRGRVEINQVITPPVLRFLNAAQDLCIPISERQRLLLEATKLHAASVMRAVRGRGVDRHITSLRQMVKEGEAVPRLFTDPLYERTRPRKIMSHCHETGMAEKGFLLRDPESIWVHYEVEDER